VLPRLGSAAYGGLIKSHIQVGSILIDDRPMIARALSMETDPYLGNWSLVRSPDGRALDRKARSAGWGFFFMAAEVRAGFLGTVAADNIRKALMRIVARKPSQSFNCLEVTGIKTRHFVAMPYTIVSAHWRHIQPGFRLKSPASGILESALPLPKCSECIRLGQEYEASVEEIRKSREPHLPRFVPENTSSARSSGCKRRDPTEALCSC